MKFKDMPEAERLNTVKELAEGIHMVLKDKGIEEADFILGMCDRDQQTNVVYSGRSLSTETLPRLYNIVSSMDNEFTELLTEMN